VITKKSGNSGSGENPVPDGDEKMSVHRVDKGCPPGGAVSIAAIFAVYPLCSFDDSNGRKRNRILILRITNTFGIAWS
jgi:hypothetical protein